MLQKQESIDASQSTKWADRFGPVFQGMATDWNALRKALTWTLRVRRAFTAASPDWQPKPGDAKAAATPMASPPPAFVQLEPRERMRPR